MALKSAGIVDLCGKSSGLADFEKTVNHGSAVIFNADSGLCRSYVRILDHRSFFSLGINVNSSKLFLFSSEVHLNSGVRLLLELYCAVVIKQIAYFTILAMVTVVFTVYQFTFEPLHLCFRMWLWFRI